jgi:hypothetical protein
MDLASNPDRPGDRGSLGEIAPWEPEKQTSAGAPPSNPGVPRGQPGFSPGPIRAPFGHPLCNPTGTGTPMAPLRTGKNRSRDQGESVCAFTHGDARRQTGVDGRSACTHDPKNPVSSQNPCVRKGVNTDILLFCAIATGGGRPSPEHLRAVLPTSPSSSPERLRAVLPTSPSSSPATSPSVSE